MVVGDGVEAGFFVGNIAHAASVKEFCVVLGDFWIGLIEAFDADGRPDGDADDDDAEDQDDGDFGGAMVGGDGLIRHGFSVGFLRAGKGKSLK